jgi:hypothetical protein
MHNVKGLSVYSGFELTSESEVIESEGYGGEVKVVTSAPTYNITVTPDCKRYKEFTKFIVDFIRKLEKDI